MTTATGAPDLGNIIGSFTRPIEKALGAFITHGEEQVKARAQAALGEVNVALQNANTQVTAAQAKVDTVVNPIVNNAIDGFVKAAEVAYPPIAPLLSAAEHEVENLADGATDAVLVKALTTLSGFLSNAGKTQLAVALENIIGAG